MTNESITSRRQILIAVGFVLAGLSMLLIPGVPAQVAQVPQTFVDSVTTAWTWLGWTLSTVFSWLS
jgi:hypothetical protein